MDQEEGEEEDQENDQSEESEELEKNDEESKGAGDSNVRKVQLHCFKYWPTKELRSAWRNYVFQEVADNNILALSIAVRILDRINSEFIQRQIENQIKK